MSVIVLKPRMSEKTYAQSQTGVFVFDIDSDLNKHQIADAVEKAYEVTVEKVRIVIQKGKAKRYYRNRRYENGVRQDVKKAYVTLKKGDSIPIFAAVEQAEEEAAKADKKAKKPKSSSEPQASTIGALKRVAARRSTSGKKDKKSEDK